MKKNRPQSRKENLVEQEVDGEILIYDLERNKAFCLNQTSAIVWQACDGKRTTAELNDLLGKQLNAQTNEDIVWLALDQLSKEKLIDPAVHLESRFEGMSRRQVIKKIGVGSMIALPVVASLVAPSSVQAQTLLAPGASSGTATGTGNCGAGSAATRQAACNTQTGMNCTSGTATEASPSGCVFTNPTFTTNCVCT